MKGVKPRRQRPSVDALHLVVMQLTDRIQVLEADSVRNQEKLGMVMAATDSHNVRLNGLQLSFSQKFEQLNNGLGGLQHEVRYSSAPPLAASGIAIHVHDQAHCHVQETKSR